jgi:hypothetical protein
MSQGNNFNSAPPNIYTYTEEKDKPDSPIPVIIILVCCCCLCGFFALYVNTLKKKVKKECFNGKAFAYVKKVSKKKFLEYRRSKLTTEELKKLHKYFVRNARENEHIYI